MRTLDEEIAETTMFAGMDPAQLELIAGCGRNERLSTGTLLMREGEPADEFFLIRSGAVALELHGPTGPLVIQTLHDGEVVGWSWLFAPYRWHMDGRVVQDASLVIFDAACLRGKAEADHDLGYQLMSRFAASLIDRLQATRFQLLDVYGRAPA